MLIEENNCYLRILTKSGSIYRCGHVATRKAKNDGKYVFREEEIRHVLNGVLTQTQKTARTDAKQLPHYQITTSCLLNTYNRNEKEHNNSVLYLKQEARAICLVFLKTVSLIHF